MELTLKQERFAQAIAKGMSGADAYRLAYDVSEDTQPDTIYKRASELVHSGKVGGRIAQLKAEIAEKSLWTREMSVQALIKAYCVAEDGSNSAGMTGAIKELNSMHGFNEAQKIDLGIRQLPSSVDEFV